MKPWVAVQILFANCCLIGFHSSFVIPRSRPFISTPAIIHSSLSSTNNVNGSNNESSQTTKNIVVLGGGFGGLYCSLALQNLLNNNQQYDNINKIKVTLVDPKDRFVFLPLLYELAVNNASLDEVAPTYASLLLNSSDGDNNATSNTVEFIQASCQAIDVENNQVYLSSSSSSSLVLPYDALVVATGMKANLDIVPGAKEYALPFYTLEDCDRLRKQLFYFQSRQEEKIVEVVVVGAGYSGVELALNLAQDNKCKVTLIHRGNEIMGNAAEYNRKSSIERLKEENVVILTSTQVLNVALNANVGNNHANKNNKVNSAAKKVVNIKNKETGVENQLTADLIMWTAGGKPADGVLNSILPRDINNRFVTGSVLRVKGHHENVFAIGDCSRASAKPLPATAQVAMQQANIAAWNVLATLNNSDSFKRRKKTKLLPFNYLPLGEMMTLGSADATISSLGGLVQINGPTASLFRRLVYAVRMPTIRQASVAASDVIVSKASSKRKSEK